MIDIIEQSVNLMIQDPSFIRYSQIARIQALLDMNFELHQTKEDSTLLVSPKGAPVYSKLKYCIDSKRMKLDSLQKFISENIFNIYWRVNSVIQEIKQVPIIKGIKSSSDYASKILYLLLSENTNGDNININIIKLILRDGIMIHEIVYGVYHNEEKAYPNFKPVIFMERDNLLRLVSEIVIMYNRPTRDNLNSVLSELLLAVFGNENRNMISEPLGELLECVSGYKIENDIFNYSLDDFNDVSITDLHEVEEMIGVFTNNIIEIRNIRDLGDDYPGIHKQIEGNRDILFYYIPLEELFSATNHE